MKYKENWSKSKIENGGECIWLSYDKNVIFLCMSKDFLLFSFVLEPSSGAEEKSVTIKSTGCGFYRLGHKTCFFYLNL